MLRFIHLSSLLEKQLRELRKAGRKAELAASKCQNIINDITQYGCQCETVLSHRTRNGEARIKNCIKYDLGGGYRLVSIRSDCHLFITFIGSHDDTDQWIEHHRYDTFLPSKTLYRCKERTDSPDVAESRYDERAEEDTTWDEYEDQLIARLDDSQLKSIFQGLFMNPVLPPIKVMGQGQ
jgi:hypothetical protein